MPCAGRRVSSVPAAAAAKPGPHLNYYLDEFTFRFNRRFYPFNSFRSLLGIAGGAAAPTFDGLYSGEWTHPTFSGCG